MLVRSLLGLAIGVALATSGCADVSGEAMRQDLAQFRQDLNATNLSVRRSRGETDAVLGQLDRRGREQAEVSQKVTARIDSLQADLGRVSTRLDEISQRLDALSRQGARPAPLPRAAPGPAPAPQPPASATAPPGPPPPSSSPPAAPRPPVEGLSPEQIYQTAYLDFSKGNYPLAVSGFREFVRRFPDP